MRLLEVFRTIRALPRTLVSKRARLVYKDMLFLNFDHVDETDQETYEQYKKFYADRLAEYKSRSRFLYFFEKYERVVYALGLFSFFLRPLYDDNLYFLYLVLFLQDLQSVWDIEQLQMNVCFRFAYYSLQKQHTEFVNALNKALKESEKHENNTAK